MRPISDHDRDHRFHRRRGSKQPDRPVERGIEIGAGRGGDRAVEAAVNRGREWTGQNGSGDGQSDDGLDQGTVT